MNKSIIFLIIVLMALHHPLKAQDQFVLTGKWKVDAGKSLGELSASQKVRYNTLSEKIKQDVQRSLSSRVYDFRPDSTLIVSIEKNGETRTSSCRWRFDTAAGILVVTLRGGERTFEVKRRSLDDIILIKKYEDEHDMLGGLRLNRI